MYVNPWEDRKFRRSREFDLIESNWDFSVYRASRYVRPAPFSEPFILNEP